MTAKGAKTILKYNKADKKTGYTLRLEISVVQVLEKFWGISFGGLLINVRKLVLIIKSRFCNSSYKTSLFDGNSQSLNRTATIFETLRS